MIAAIVMAMAAAPVAPVAARCDGIVLYTGKTPTCSPLPPLVDACRAVRACAAKGVCAITVTGTVERSEFEAAEAWGDWHARLTGAPPALRVSAAAIVRLAGRPLASAPYTLFLSTGRKPLIADGLFTDPLETLSRWAAGGTPPDGLRGAPADVTARICPSQPSRRATSRAK